MVRKTDRFEWPDNCAFVSQNFTSDWVRYYEWADAKTRKFTGKFLTIEDAVKAIPQHNRFIKVNITDQDGKEVSYTIDRNVATKI